MGESPDRVERNGGAGEDRAAKPESWFSRTGTAEPSQPTAGPAPTEPEPDQERPAERPADRPADPRAEAPASADAAAPASEAGTEARSEARTDAGSGADATDADTGDQDADGTAAEESTAAGAEADAGAGTESGPGAGTDARPEADSGAGADAGPGTGAGPGSGAGSDAGTRAGAGAGVAVESSTGAGADRESGAGSDTGAEVPVGASAAGASAAAAEDGRGAALRLDSPTTALRAPKLDEPTRALRQVSIPQGPREHTEVPPVDVPEPWAPEQHPSEQQTAEYRAPEPSGLGQFGWGYRDEPSAQAGARSPQSPAQPYGGRPGTGSAPISPSPESTSEAMDVLAALSRKPRGPLRRALKRITLWGGLLVFLLVILAIVQVLRPLPAPTLKMTTDSAYAFGGSAPTLDWPASGQATAEVSGLGNLGHSGSDDPVAIASVTKVMTAHLILKDHPLTKDEQGPTITVDQQAVDDYNNGIKDQESVVKVTVGEQISEYQALQMLLIPSANNIARLLGRWDAGTDAAFVTKMQAEATALSMSKSTYTDPSGLEGTTKSTANDQLKLAEVVMQDAVFREIVSTPSFTPPGGTVTYNNNSLLGKNGVIGIKTGTSSAALGCLMWAAQTKVGGTTQTVVGVVLSQPATGGDGGGWLPNVLKNSSKVIVSAEQALKSHTVARKGDVVGYVDDGLGGKTPVVVSKDVTVAGWGGLSVDISLTPTSGGLPHQAAAGTTVGSLVVGTGATAQTVPVVLQSKLKQPTAASKLTRLG
ncbi:D-alanyl-D-alanine carboxypeptidase [Streptacidiphilus sp. N1-10]|uniref:D-alanyl-D-alanine carboxypeptidase n=1 Tax=Streptacidiphilus jeojiensis TaxID=3229225 RepID=A0ABV6XI80_9ACTN